MIKLDNLIREAKFKLEALPESYFINYFEQDFLPELNKTCKKLWQVYNRCNEQADNLPMAELQNEIKGMLSDER